MANDPLLKTFLPATPAPPAPPPPGGAAKAAGQPPAPARTGASASAPPDREADPKVRRARDLCDYGYKILDDIYKDYQLQIGGWKNQFGEIISALFTAAERRDQTLQAAQKERERDAAEEAFVVNLIFSLATMGSMAFLGEFVKASLPNVKLGSLKTDFADKWNVVGAWERNAYVISKVLQVETVVLKTPIEFTKFQTGLFGTLLKDTGNKLIPLAFPSPPAPRAAPPPVTTKAGIESIRTDFEKMMTDSAALVLGQIKKVQQWMNQESEFGEAWLADSKGNMEIARASVLRHMQGLRDDWAKNWEFFGKSPAAVPRALLAEQYERAWWATHVIDALTIFPYGKIMNPEDQGWETIFPLGRGRRKILEGAIVSRLRELNIVFAETQSGLIQQMQDASKQGVPVPEVYIDGAVDWDDYGEAVAAYKWAKAFLNRAPGETTGKFFPAARTRQLEPLRAAQY